MARGRPRTVTHGDPSMYSTYKCRCDKCVRANTEYRRELRRKRAYESKNGVLTPGLKHGSLYVYQSGCRCAECTAANSAHYRAQAGGSAPKNPTPKWGTKPSTGGGGLAAGRLLEQLERL